MDIVQIQGVFFHLNIEDIILTDAQIMMKNPASSGAQPMLTIEGDSMEIIFRMGVTGDIAMTPVLMMRMAKQVVPTAKL